MFRKLPSLKALQAFEAAARHLNFTRAADELGVTQGAVSKQVALLESHFGARLFERSGKHMALTKEGACYLPALTEAFDLIAGASAPLAARKAGGELLTVSILPSLSSRWLIPRLDAFRRLHTRYDVRVIIGDGPIDFAQSEADIAIRAGRKIDWKGLHAEPLMEEELLAVASPRLLTARRIEKPGDFLKLPLLEHTTRPGLWQEYLETMGTGAIKVKHALGFEHFFMLIQAALDGMGAALIPRFLILRELEEKSLMVAYDKPFKSPYRYYFICPERMLHSRKIKAFRSWLGQQVLSGK